MSTQPRPASLPGGTSPDPAPAGHGRRSVDARWRTAAVALAAALVLALSALAAGLAVQGRGYPESSPEVGFARDMHLHHDQAVVMSQLVGQRGSDPEVAQLARDIVTSQAEQQGVMLGWLRAEGLPATTAQESMGWMSAAEGAAAGGHDPHDMGASPGPVPARDAPAVATAAGSGPEAARAAMGMATDEELSELGRRSGAAADLLYVQLMQRHHVGAVAMAEAFTALSDEPQLSWLADGILVSQERELRILADQEERLAAQVAAG